MVCMGDMPFIEPWLLEALLARLQEWRCRHRPRWRSPIAASTDHLRRGLLRTTRGARWRRWREGFAEIHQMRVGHSRAALLRDVGHRERLERRLLVDIDTRDELALCRALQLAVARPVHRDVHCATSDPPADKEPARAAARLPARQPRRISPRRALAALTARLFTATQRASCSSRESDLAKSCPRVAGKRLHTTEALSQTLNSRRASATSGSTESLRHRLATTNRISPSSSATCAWS